MKQLIDKGTLVAETERRIKGLKDCHADTVAGYAGEISGLERLLSFIDALETKEVDLEEELDKYTTDNFWALDGNNESPYLLEKDDMLKVAKYFYELGLKTQKGE